MPPGMFNTEASRGADWDTMLEARREFEAGLDSSGGIGAGPMLLIGGAAILGVILIAMALFAS